MKRAKPVPASLIKISVRRQAFTLVELLVVIGIIALLVSILLPALNKARQSADAVRCLSNLRQMGVGAALYVNEWGYWPVPFSTGTFEWSDQIARYTNTLGWQPDNLYLGGRYSGMVNVPWSYKDRTIFACPSDVTRYQFNSPSYALTSYSYNWDLECAAGFSPPDPRFFHRAVKTRHTSNHALIACGGGVCGGGRRVFYYGLSAGSRQDTAMAWHNNKGNMVFCDFHAEPIKVERDGNGTPIPMFFGGAFDGYLIDRTIQIQWDDQALPLPRVPFP